MKPSILLTRTVSPSALMFAALMIGATPALAASPGTDATFMQEVVRTESIETRIGQLAVEKASSADVKKLGQMLIDDYAATGQESARIANTLQVSRPVDDAIARSPACLGRRSIAPSSRRSSIATGRPSPTTRRRPRAAAARSRPLPSNSCRCLKDIWGWRGT
jgi:hypothetical protein